MITPADFRLEYTVDDQKYCAILTRTLKIYPYTTIDCNCNMVDLKNHRMCSHTRATFTILMYCPDFCRLNPCTTFEFIFKRMEFFWNDS